MRQSLRVLATRVPAPLRRFAKRFFVPAAFLRYLKRESEAQKLHQAMLAGFGTAAAKKLEALPVNRPPRETAEAAWALALWHASIGEYGRALDCLTARCAAAPGVHSDPLHLVIKVEALLRLGRFVEAEKAIREAAGLMGDIPELCFCGANAAALNPQLSPTERDRLRLEWLNKPLIAAGLAPMELKDAAKALALDNITVQSAATHPRSGEAKISVLLPAYNAGSTIACAMTSVLGQTWSNLELIVVDDGSSDDTWSVIETFATRDPRVVPLRHEQNRGAYAARNRAMRQATGDLITVHDADDWSHPQKLALQAVALLDGDQLANATKQIRVYPCMRVYVKPDGSTILDCYPSLMIPKAVLSDLGSWDECRMGADDELWKRLLAKHKRNKVVLEEATPLSFHLFRDGSLTAEPHIGASSLYYGARRQYREAYRFWHQLEMSKADPDLSVRPGERRFPMPHICKPGPQRRLTYDFLVVSDLSLPAETIAHSVELLYAAHALRLRCGCFHWPRLEFAGQDIDLEIRKLLHEGIADNIVAGESLDCGLVVVSDASVLDHLPDIIPEIRAQACLVLADGGTDANEGREGNAKTAFAVVPQLASMLQIEERLRFLRAGHPRKSAAKPRPGSSAVAQL